MFFEIFMSLGNLLQSCKAINTCQCCQRSNTVIPYAKYAKYRMIEMKIPYKYRMHKYCIYNLNYCPMKCLRCTYKLILISSWTVNDETQELSNFDLN